MRSVLALAVMALAAIAPVTASTERMAQITKRASGPTDVEILNYVFNEGRHADARRASRDKDIFITLEFVQFPQEALTLEHLEKNFYFQGLDKFRPDDFKKAGFGPEVFKNIQKIAIQEKDHVEFLAGALGSAGVSQCKYDFKVAFTNVYTFVSTARILESVGTAAYLGAAPDISSKAYLAAAGSILTIEARHTAILNTFSGDSGFPVAFETSLDYAQVYSLAAGFIKPNTCGKNGALPSSIQRFPSLSIENTPRAGHTTEVQFNYRGDKETGFYAAFLNGGATIIKPVKHGKDGKDRVDIPKGLEGITYIVITTSSKTLSDSNTVAGPAIAIL
ncbi:BZ3500_MvSof-1268-A1-R1_Chr3-1g06020 [Microbotryum saponariae]|uniref:BZ3500_MvSof-1268-A1-R1_Chr3-1g06020 protein n=1 Tax=Microbotryum saponariae TaxID=289078 RepID=A0A2X0L4R7_9BASI|nr:BZ3500_MvSof-1268-A1-R1_Chr3-1g06020 [Microbotryum saponariae]SDA05210.1 BZ3501_MvSof-1269-A2-R1_Chr3-1g05690 [Microbotryum saponariae]